MAEAADLLPDNLFSGDMLMQPHAGYEDATTQAHPFPPKSINLVLYSLQVNYFIDG